MFDIGFSEIALLAIVALLVLGPERLPRAARTAGALVRRARASWNNVRSEIEREFAAEDIKKSIADAKAAMNDTARSIDPRPDLEAVKKSMRGENSAEPPPDDR